MHTPHLFSPSSSWSLYEQAVIDRLLERKRAKQEDEAARDGSGGGLAGQLELGQQQGQQQQRRRQGQGQDELTELSFEELVSLAQPTDLGECAGIALC